MLRMLLLLVSICTKIKLKQIFTIDSNISDNI
jgi:hypothetical protein